MDCLISDSQCDLVNVSMVTTVNLSEEGYRGATIAVAYVEDTPGASKTWGWWLLTIGTPLVLTVGLPGNILTLLVMKTHRYQVKSYSHYFCALAVFDSLVLIGKAMRRVDSVLVESGRYGLFHIYGDVACKIHNFAEHVCYLTSSWLVVCLTAERCVVVFYPLVKDLVCRPRHAITVIICVFAVAFYSQLFRLVIFEHDHSTNTVAADGCVASEQHQQLYVYLHIYLYQLVLQFLLPTSLIIVGNMAVMYRIRIHRRRPLMYVQDRVARCRHSSTTRPRSSLRTTAVLFAVSFTYLITLLPLLTVSVTMHIALTTDAYFPVAISMFTSLGNVNLVFELLSELNYATNFYIYVLTAEQFRQQLVHCLSGCPSMCSREGQRRGGGHAVHLHPALFDHRTESPGSSWRHSTVVSELPLMRLSGRGNGRSSCYGDRQTTASVMVDN